MNKIKLEETLASQGDLRDKRKTTTMNFLEFVIKDVIYIAVMQGPFHTMPERFENAANALFRRLALLSTLIRHENGAFRKRYSNWRNLKTPDFRFRVAGNHFENGAFRKRCSHVNHAIFLSR